MLRDQSIEKEPAARRAPRCRPEERARTAHVATRAPVARSPPYRRPSAPRCLWHVLVAADLGVVRLRGPRAHDDDGADVGRRRRWSVLVLHVVCVRERATHIRRAERRRPRGRTAPSAARARWRRDPCLPRTRTPRAPGSKTCTMLAWLSGSFPARPRPCRPGPGTRRARACRTASRTPRHAATLQHVLRTSSALWRRVRGHAHHR